MYLCSYLKLLWLTGQDFLASAQQSTELSNTMSDEERDVDEPEAMEEDSAEVPVDLEIENEEGDENDNPNKQNADGSDSPEPTDEDPSEKMEKLHKFPLGRVKNIMKLG